MSNCPLYDTLCHNISDKALNNARRIKVTEYVPKMNDDEKMTMMHPIIEHYTRTTNKKCKKPPYKISENKKGIAVDFDELPNNLQWILYKFISVIKRK